MDRRSPRLCIERAGPLRRPPGPGRCAQNGTDTTGAGLRTARTANGPHLARRPRRRPSPRFSSPCRLRHRLARAISHQGRAQIKKWTTTARDEIGPEPGGRKVARQRAPSGSLSRHSPMRRIVWPGSRRRHPSHCLFLEDGGRVGDDGQLVRVRGRWTACWCSGVARPAGGAASRPLRTRAGISPFSVWAGTSGTCPNRFAQPGRRSSHSRFGARHSAGVPADPRPPPNFECVAPTRTFDGLAIHLIIVSAGWTGFSVPLRPAGRSCSPRPLRRVPWRPIGDAGDADARRPIRPPSLSDDSSSRSCFRVLQTTLRGPVRRLRTRVLLGVRVILAILSGRGSDGRGSGCSHRTMRVQSEKLCRGEAGPCPRERSCGGGRGKLLAILPDRGDASSATPLLDRDGGEERDSTRALDGAEAELLRLLLRKLVRHHEDGED